MLSLYYEILATPLGFVRQLEDMDQNSCLEVIEIQVNADCQYFSGKGITVKPLSFPSIVLMNFT